MVELDTDSDVPELVRLLVEAGADILSLTPERTTLEQLFLRILGSEGGL